MPPLKEIARYMRMGQALPEGALLECVNALSHAAEAVIEPRSTDARVSDAEWWLCATLGARFDVWQRRVSLQGGTEALIAQAIGTAELETYLDAREAEIRAQLKPNERAAARVSPGYGKLPLDMSRRILERLDAGKRIGVTLTEQCLLAPSKSVTAIIRISTGEGE